MRLDDFCRLTSGEFGEVCKAYHSERESESRAAWERTRMLAAITIQPHVKNRITPAQLLPFPWEKPALPKRGATPQLTAAQSKKRFEQIVKRMKTGN